MCVIWQIDDWEKIPKRIKAYKIVRIRKGVMTSLFGPRSRSLQGGYPTKGTRLVYEFLNPVVSNKPGIYLFQTAKDAHDVIETYGYRGCAVIEGYIPKNTEARNSLSTYGKQSLNALKFVPKKLIPKNKEKKNG